MPVSSKSQKVTVRHACLSLKQASDPVGARAKQYTSKLIFHLETQGKHEQLSRGRLQALGLSLYTYIHAGSSSCTSRNRRAKSLTNAQIGRTTVYQMPVLQMFNRIPRVALLAERNVTHRTMKMHASLRHKTLLIMQVTRQVLTPPPYATRFSKLQ